MIFTFKKYPQDFIVYENLGFELSNQDRFLYVYFQKESQNTMDLIAKRSKQRGVERKVIGMSGLKDRNAITRQWMSIPQQLVQQKGGKDSIICQLQHDVEIITYQRHHHALQIGQHSSNAFTIRLRATKPLSSHLKTNIISQRKKIQQYGFPNLFGIQRFGPGNKNFHEAYDLLKCAKNIPDSQYILRFIVQAYPSMLFNNYALMRRNMRKSDNDYYQFLDGDILVSDPSPRRTSYYIYHDRGVYALDYTRIKQEMSNNEFIRGCTLSDDLQCSDIRSYIPTGPLLGMKTILPLITSLSYQYEENLYNDSIMKEGGNLIKRLHIYGGRRPLITYIQDGVLEREGNDMIVSFTLPTGSYATVLFAYLFGNIDEKTCIQNRRLLPSVVHATRLGGEK